MTTAAAEQASRPDALPQGALATALIVAIAAFMQMLDSSIIGTALPQMGRTFGVSPVDVGQGIIVYVLAAAIVIPASGWMADRFGARRVFVGMMLVFTLASYLCGISTNLTAFVAARALQGVSGALMGATGQLILVRSVDRSHLLRLMNISSIPVLVAPVLGPPLGGFITQTLGWSWIFYFNVPVGIVGAVIALRYLKPLPLDHRPFDGLGFLLNGMTLALLLFSLERMTGSASRAPAIAAAVAGLLLGWLAVRHLNRVPHPILSLSPLRFQTFRVSAATTLPLIRLPIGGLLFVLPIMLQVGFGMTAFAAGIALLGHAGGDLLMKPLMTRTFRRFGYRRILVVGTAATMVGIGACGLFTAGTSLAAIVAVAFVAGCARSFIMTGLTTLAFDEVPQSLVPSATALSMILMQLGAALSVTLATIFFDVSAVFRHGPAGVITVDDCRNVLWILSAIGLLALPALLSLPRDAGDRLSGRAPASPVEE